MEAGKNIDDLFKSKLGQKDIAFDEHAWEGMEVLLDNSENKKKAIVNPRSLIASGTLVAAVALALFLSADKDAFVVEHTNTFESNSTVEVTTTENLTPSESHYEGAVQPTPIPIEGASGDNELEDNLKVQELQNATSGAASATATNVNIEPKNDNTRAHGDLIQATNIHSTPVKADVSHPGEASPIGLNSSTFITENANAINLNRELASAGNDERGFSDNQIIEFTSEPTIANPADLREHIDRMSYIRLYKKHSHKPKELLIRPYKDRLNLLRRLSVGLQFGTNMAIGYVHMDPSIGRSQPSIRPYGGVNLSLLFDEMFTMDAGVIYSTRGSFNLEYNEFVSTGLKTITPTSTRMLSVPISFHYRRDRVGYFGGMQYAHLLSTYTETSTPELNTGTITYATGTEVITGSNANSPFKPSDFSLMFGGEYVVSPALNIGTRVNWGTGDFTESVAKGTNTHKNRNIEFKVYLEYKLFRY